MTDKKRATAELQQWLRNISKSESDLPAIIPDGIYSRETRLEVEKLQRKKGLDVTGIVDYVTWEAIRLENQRLELENEFPVQVAPITNSDLPLKKGDNSIFTDTLKLMLRLIAEDYKNFELYDEAGFGEKTEKAVKEWQSVAFLERTGEVDKVTWNSLASYYLK